MKEIKVGDIIEGTVVRVYPKYAIMLFDEGRTGLLHISELSNAYIRNFTAFVQVGNIYKVKVIDEDEKEGFLKVSLKQMTYNERHRSLSRIPIDKAKISFKELQKRLPAWILEENATEGEKQ